MRAIGENIDELKNVLKKLQTQPENNATDTEKVRVLCKLAFVLCRTDPKQAEDYAQQALKLAKKTKFRKGEAEGHMIIGTSYYVRGNYDKALKSYKKSLKVCEQIGEKKGIANCYGNIGNIHKNLGDYEQALGYHMRALKIKEEIGDKSGMAGSHNNIGIIYDEQKECDQALDCYKKALRIFEELENKQGIAFSYNNIGIIFQANGDRTRASEYYHKSLKLKEELGDIKGIASSYLNIGSLYEEQKDYNHALEYSLKGLKTFEEIGDKRNIANSNNKIGHIHTQLKRYDSAQVYLQKGLAIAQEIGTKDWEADSYYSLYALYEAQKDFEQALIYHKKYNELKEKIFWNINTEKIAQMRIRYKTERAEKEAEIYRSIFENTVLGMYRLAPDGHILMANSALVSMLGYSSFEELMLQNDAGIDSEHPIFDFNKHLTDKKELLRVESIWHKRDGTSVNIRKSTKYVQNELGITQYIEGTVEDITKIKQAQKALQENEEQYRIIVENAMELIWQLDTKANFIFFNKYAEEITGQISAEWRGKPFTPIVHPNNLAAIKTHLQKTIAGNSIEYEIQIFNVRGDIIDLEVQSMPIYNKGKVTGTLSFGRDITTRKQYEKERELLIAELETTRESLQFKATHDSLTSIWNRSAILNSLENELARSNRSNTSIGVIIADIDHFKKINDQFGHLVGDAVLREVAQKLVIQLRPYDRVGRYGGEEFIFVLPDCDYKGTLQIAERLRSSFSDNPITIPEGVFNVTVSFGITNVYGYDGGNMDSIIQTIDNALYRAKNAGRNRVETA
ncbi:diguanylate cyclase [bacterium]|nr:diguanylate cyclase [bacterium]